MIDHPLFMRAVLGTVSEKLRLKGYPRWRVQTAIDTLTPDVVSATADVVGVTIPDAPQPTSNPPTASGQFLQQLLAAFEAFINSAAGQALINALIQAIISSFGGSKAA
jgi:hypothetical protein